MVALVELFLVSGDVMKEVDINSVLTEILVLLRGSVQQVGEGGQHVVVLLEVADYQHGQCEVREEIGRPDVLHQLVGPGPPPDHRDQGPHPPVHPAPEVEQAGHVDPAGGAHGEIALQTSQGVFVLDERDPGVEDLLDVLTAGEEGLDDAGELLAVPLDLQQCLVSGETLQVNLTWALSPPYRADLAWKTSLFLLFFFNSSKSRVMSWSLEHVPSPLMAEPKGRTWQ